MPPLPLFARAIHHLARCSRFRHSSLYIALVARRSRIQQQHRFAFLFVVLDRPNFELKLRTQQLQPA